MMQNFQHLLLDEGAEKVAGRFQKKLVELEKLIVKRNGSNTRLIPNLGFLPSHMALSIS